ncbi:hypothetical protein BgiBS90_022377 [Biomphalaria glabrata]|nr:hypothetical protein BgiBS90_022377 [Biomphalaria glabrata]
MKLLIVLVLVAAVSTAVIIRPPQEDIPLDDFIFNKYYGRALVGRRQENDVASFLIANVGKVVNVISGLFEGSS